MHRRFFLAIGLFLLISPLWTAEQQEKIQEAVHVVNIEVPVRVYHQGRPVVDLTRDDFSLYEKGVQTPVNGFFVRRKQITPAENTAPGAPARTFVFMFNLSQVNDEVKKALDWLFSGILRRGDHLLVFVNGKTLDWPQLGEAAAVKAELLQQLQESGRDKRQRLDYYFRQVEANPYYKSLKNPASSFSEAKDDDIEGFIRTFLELWNEFKTTFLVPDLEPFYHFCRYLEKTRGEKWVLNFYQVETFPRILDGSRVEQEITAHLRGMEVSSDPFLIARKRRLEEQLNHLRRALDYTAAFPADDVAKLFYKADATFFSFITSSRRDSGDPDLVHQRIYSDFAAVLQSLTRVSGGLTVQSADFAAAVRRISDVEDVYYVLTYSPADPEAPPQPIEVKVRNRDFEVRYDDRHRAAYFTSFMERMQEKEKLPEIAIRDGACNGRELSFHLSGFLFAADRPNALKVRVRVVSEMGENRFDEAREFTAAREDISIRLNLPELPPGGYYAVIDAADGATGKNAFRQFPFTVH